jgi:hypothetical protein
LEPAQDLNMEKMFFLIWNQNRNHENLVQKTDYEVLEFEKNEIKIEIKGFKFWKNSTQTPTQRTSA